MTIIVKKMEILYFKYISGLTHWDYCQQVYEVLQVER